MSSSFANSGTVCGCLDFKTGTRIVSAFYSFLNTAVICYVIAADFQLKDDLSDVPNELNNANSLHVYFVVMGVVCGIYLLFSLMLLLGEKHQGYLLPWMILTMLNVIGAFKFFIYMALYNAFVAHVVISLIVGVVINLYCYYVVQSYYKHLRELKRTSDIRYFVQKI